MIRARADLGRRRRQLRALLAASVTAGQYKTCKALGPVQARQRRRRHW
jgi:hypothetical protein